jgi:hypothetical protein
VVDYNSQGSTRNALVKQEMRHTFRRKPGDKEQRKLLKQQGLNQVSKPEKKTISFLLGRVGHTQTLG